MGTVLLSLPPAPELLALVVQLSRQVAELTARLEAPPSCSPWWFSSRDRWPS